MHCDDSQETSRAKAMNSFSDPLTRLESLIACMEQSMPDSLDAPSAPLAEIAAEMKRQVSHARNQLAASELRSQSTAEAQAEAIVSCAEIISELEET